MPVHHIDMDQIGTALVDGCDIASQMGKIGSQSRADIEALLGHQVNLQLWVKVRTGWLDNLNDLKSLGYAEQ